MPVLSTVYFQTDALKARFARDIADALVVKRISVNEGLWLELLFDAPAALLATDPPRMDRLVTEDGKPTNAEMTGALLISHSDRDKGQVYLSTLLFGLERFDSRVQLQARLNTLFAVRAADNPAFEFELLEESRFGQRTLDIIDQQNDHLQALNEHLQGVPTLAKVMDQAIARQLATLETDTLPYVQIIKSGIPSGGGVVSRFVLNGQTLAQSLADRFTGKTLPADQQQAFVNDQGLVVDAVEQQYPQVLKEAIEDLKLSGLALLDTYWSSTLADGQTVQESVAAAFREGLRQEILAHAQAASLSPEEFTHLAALFRPARDRRNNGDQTSVNRLTVVSDDSDPLKLIGLLVIEFHSAQWPDLLLYSPVKGLRRYRSFDVLSDELSTTAGRTELLGYLSLNDHALMTPTAALRFERYVIEHESFAEQSSSIKAFQERNLKFVLGFKQTDIGEAAALVDDALDVRHLIDRRLLNLDSAGRWYSGDAPFADRWAVSTSVVSSTVTASPDLMAPTTLAESNALSSSWQDRLNGIEKRLQQVLSVKPDVGPCAIELLAGYLAVSGARKLNPEQVMVRWPDGVSDDEQPTGAFDATGAPLEVNLLTLLLERLSGIRTGPVPATCVMQFPSATGPSATWLTPMIVNHVLDRIEQRFFAALTSQRIRYHNQPLRLENRQVEPGKVVHDVLSNLMYLNSELEDRLEVVTREMLSMFEQVLNFPQRSMRLQFGDYQAEVSRLYLIHDPLLPPVLMTGVIILSRPALPAEPLLSWSMLSGLQQVDSIEDLALMVNISLSRSVSRERWLGLIAEPDRSTLRRYLERPQKSAVQVTLVRVEGSCISALQHDAVELEQRGLKYAWSHLRGGRFTADAFARYLLIAETDNQLLSLLDGVSIAVQNSIFQVQLPPWLRNVSTEKLVAYAELARRCYQNSDPAQYFLSDVPSLGYFANQQLRQQLKLDFPTQDLDPDTVGITLTRYVVSPVPMGDTPSSIAAATIVEHGTLTQYAINHFASVQGAILSVNLPPDTPNAQRLTAYYVNALVRKLDVGKKFQALLERKLDEKSPGYELRRKRYVTQMPVQLLLIAMEMKLQNRLTEKAFAFIECLLEMPDGIARQPVYEQNIVLQPLQLIAASDMAPDPVQGVFLIGPRDLSQGPVILHTFFSIDYFYKEYASRADFMQDLRASEDLQALVLDRVDPEVRSRYDNGGFSEAHIPWNSESSFDFPPAASAVEIGPTAEAGNAMQRMFTETLALLKSLAKKQTVTNAQADWTSFVHLMSLGAEQVLMFLPGRLGLMAALWQSQSLFKASAEAAHGQQWGKALSEFSAALGTLISSREAAEALEEESPATESLQEKPAAPYFSWRNSQLPTDLKTRLREFEAHDIALSHLQKDELYNLYLDTATLKEYAAVAGKVYQVQAFEGQWYLMGQHGRGPKIRLNIRQQWELDLEWGLRGGGGVLTRLKTSAVDFSVEEALYVEARGIREIRGLYRERALKINDARMQSIKYLRNCLFNLEPTTAGAELDPRALSIISDFFGVQPPTPELIMDITRTASDLLVGITDPSLSMFSSTRYVTGTNKPGHEATGAFVIRADPKQRIFFTELFFNTLPFRLKPDRPGHDSFNVGTHYRSAILIHELSHLVNHTYDIAYLEATAPYPDLLQDSSDPQDTFKFDLLYLQIHGFSHHSQPGNLFIKNESSGWRDLEYTDGPQKAFVLKTTERQTLDEARSVFLSDAQKRSKLILSNADSVTLLILLLGRKTFS